MEPGSGVLCPPPGVLGDRGEWKLLCALPGRGDCASRRGWAQGSEIRAPRGLLDRQEKSSRVLASEPRTQPAGVRMSSGSLPVSEPRAPAGPGCVSLPVSPSVCIRGKNISEWRWKACCDHSCWSRWHGAGVRWQCWATWQVLGTPCIGEHCRNVKEEVMLSDLLPVAGVDRHSAWHLVGT